MKGQHLTGEFYSCQATVLCDVEAARECCLNAVRSVGLHAVNDVFHSFGVGLGFTGVVLLAESHMSIHTWPELQSVTLDVYVCNYSTDNSAAAEQLFESLVEYFQPKRMERQAIERGQTVIREPITAHVTQLLSDCTVLEQGRTKLQNYGVYQHPNFGKLLTLDGVCLTSERDEFIYHEMLTHLPACSIQTPLKALVVGGGDGGCVEELLKHPSIELIDLVEIDAGVIDIAQRHFQSVHQGAFDNPKVRLCVTDGLMFVSQTMCNKDTYYDLIYLDLTDPTGLANDLYQAVFFQNCSKILNANGILTLHLGSPFFHQNRVRHLLQELNRIFKYVRPFGVSVPLYGGYWGFATASQVNDPIHITHSQLRQQIDKRHLSDLSFYSPESHISVLQLPPFFAKLNAR